MIKDEVILEALPYLMCDPLRAEDLLADTVEYDWLEKHNLLRLIGKVTKQEELYGILQELNIPTATKTRIEKTMRKDLK
jgi:hypothetical protein